VCVSCVCDCAGKCVQYLVDNSEGFSGAEMTMICREAVMVAVEDDPNAKALSSKHLVRACNAATARTSPEMIAYYDAYRAQHSNLAC
jgi:AAA family ATPase